MYMWCKWPTLHKGVKKSGWLRWRFLDDLDIKRVGPTRAKAAAAVNFVSHVSFKFNELFTLTILIRNALKMTM